MWCNFQESVNEDETINQVFCAEGIFKIWGEDSQHLLQHPNVKAMVQNKKMIVSVDQSLVMLEEENIGKCNFVGFGSKIEALAVSSSGNLIICGLSDGEIHGIFIKGVALFNLSINIDDIQEKRTFVGFQQINQKFYVCCVNGSIYRLNNIEELSLENWLNISFTNNETAAFEDASLDKVSLTRVTNVKGLKDVTAFILVTQFHGECENFPFISIYGTKSSIRFHSESGKDIEIVIPKHFEGVRNFYNMRNFFLVLTNSGHLLQICPVTKIVNYQTPATQGNILIEDLIALENNEEIIELQILTKSGKSEHSRLMQFIEYPSFKVINEFEMPNSIWLVNQSKCSVNLYFLVGININDQGIPQEIEMRLLSETEPAERIKKLIAKGHMEEAEEFGKQFNLSLQPIYEAKAKRMILLMSTSDSETAMKLFENLVEILQKIEDANFFRNNYSISMPNRRLLQMYLGEMIKRLTEEIDASHILEIKEQQLRLQTLELIDPFGSDPDWQKFVYHSHIEKICAGMFKTDMLTACVIWKRHSSAIIPKLDYKDLCKLLTLIPNNTEPFNLIQWLRVFIPVVINLYPDIMRIITDWSIQKTRSLQFSDYWPEIGLEFATKVTDIFNDVNFLHCDVRRQQEKSTNKLRDLVNALQDLSVLKKSYNLTFTLDSYLQESTDETAFCILQRVHLVNLKSLVNDFLYPIFRERGESPVNAIRKYIQYLVAHRVSLTSWLERSITSIELLHNEDDRLESSLLVLNAAPVPWPDMLAPLIKLRHSTHPLAKKINTEYEIQFIKIMKIKYGWRADATDSNMKLVHRIIKVDLPEMTDDIKIVTKADPNIAVDANLCCCYELARKGKIEVAMRFLQSLESSHNIKCCEKIINNISRNLQDPKHCLSENEIKNFVEFLKSITLHSPSKYAQENLKNIQNRLILQKRFSLECPQIQHLRHMKTRLQLLNEGIVHIIEKSKTSKRSVSEYIWQEVTILAKALDLEKMLGIIQVCRRMNCLPFSSVMAYNTLELIDCSRVNSHLFIEFALILIAQQIVMCKRNPGKASITFMDTLSYPLAYALLTHSLNFEKKLQLEVIEFLKWIRIVNLSYNSNDISNYYKDKYGEINEQIIQFLETDSNETIEKGNHMNNAARRQSVSIFDEIVCPQNKEMTKNTTNNTIPIVNFISHTLLLVILELKLPYKIFIKLSEHIPDSIKHDVDGTRKNFYNSLEHLIKTKQHNTWYIVAQYLLHYQQNSKASIIHADFVSLNLQRVFRNILSHKEPNFIDLFAMLVNENSPNILLDNLLENCKNYQQKINILTLSEMYSSYTEDAVRLESIKASRIKYFYYMEFCKHDTALKNKFDIDTITVNELMAYFKNMLLDVRLLEKLSKDFDWDYQQTLVAQVIAILNAQEISFTVRTDTFGNEELEILNSVDKIKSLCQPYIDEIKNMDLLASKLLNFIGEINYYFYELYLCVIDILTYIDAVPKTMYLWSNILHFLKHKMISRRRYRPTQIETDLWLQSQSEIGVLPKIAKFRLPFMPIVQRPLKDILDDEVCIDDCISWFPLIQMHTTLQDSPDSGEIKKLQDYFSMSAVKNCIADYKAKSKSDEWNLQPTNNAFLKSILRLVKHVTNPTRALMILYFVSNYAPDGSDQVQASHECYKFALEHEQELSDEKKGHEILVKIKRKYPILKTQHLLHVYGLVEDKLMQLVENPTALIYQLYNHEIILGPNKPNINKMAKQIANLHGLDIETTIQFSLLQKWLLVSNDSMETTNLEETFYEDVNHSSSINGDTNSLENVMRAYYILNSWDKKKAMSYLLGSIFPHDRTTANTGKLLLLYECFSQLNDGSTDFTGVLNQQNYITIKCVHELKQFGYNFSVEKFADYNKIEILKKIWQNHPDNSSALDIMANICLGFNIYLPKIWNGILKRMVMLKMLSQLDSLVDMLSCKPEILHIDGLAIAWEYVLKAPFKKANRTKSFEQEETLIKTLFKLQSCPLGDRLNLYEIAEDCVRLERAYMGAITIAMCKEEESVKIKKLMGTQKNQMLRKEIMNLNEYGILLSIINSTVSKLQI